MEVRDRITEGMNPRRLALELRRSARHGAVLGAVALAAAACLGVIFKNINANPFGGDDYQLRVAVDDAKGVVPGRHEVRISGVRVGTITDVDFADGRAILTARIERRHGRLYRNARLRLRPTTALQDMFLDVVDRGSERAGVPADGEQVPAQRVQVAVDVARVLDVFDADTRPHLRRILVELGAGLDGRGDELSQAFAELTPFIEAVARLTRESARRARLTRRLVRNTRVLTGELARRGSDLRRLVSQGSSALTRTAEVSSALDATLVELPLMLEQLERALGTVGSTLDQVDPALVALEPVAAALPAGLTSLERVSEQAAPAARDLTRSVRALAPLSDHLAPVARDLGAATADFVPQLEPYDHVTRSAAKCEYPIERFFQWTPSIFKYGDAHGPYPRGEAVVTTTFAGGAVVDPNLISDPTCTGGRPRGGRSR